MTPTDAFGLSGAWSAAAESVIRLMTDGVDPRDLVLAEGYGSTLAVERYAREYCRVSPRASLAITYGIASVGVCVAGQGAWVLPCPIKGGGELEVPLIQHFIGVAPSGWRKSTALDSARRPLQRALRKGVRARTEALRVMRDQAERIARELLEQNPDPRRGGNGADIDRKQFVTIFTAGICPSTTIKDPTVEALRDFIIENGGVGAVLSAEADVFRNIAAYASDSGSLTFFLDLWQQESISTARVSKGLIQMDEAALIMAVLFQNDVFAEVTGGSGSRGGGADSFISRGMFGRFFVVRAAEAGGYIELAQDYADDDDFAATGLDGMCDENGVVTALGDALIEYEGNLEKLVEESNPYRMHKALRNKWDSAMREYGSDLQIGEFEEIPRHRLHLDAAARLAYRRVQRLQLAVESALAEPQIEEDVRQVFSPLASRITQHIMREALTMALGAGYRTVTGPMIEDAATRLFPWRVAHTADALLTRSQEIATENVARMSVENPTMADRTPDGAVLRALAKLAATGTAQERGQGFTRSQVSAKVRDGFSSKTARNGVSGLVASTLERLVSAPDGVVTARVDGMDGRKQPVIRYMITERAMLAE